MFTQAVLWRDGFRRKRLGQGHSLFERELSHPSLDTHELMHWLPIIRWVHTAYPRKEDGPPRGRAII
jgi:hypothetical protein